jgi:MFS family permease
MTVLIILIAPIAGRSSDRIGSRALMTVGMLCLAASLALFSRLGLDSTFWDILPGLIVGGFGMALVMTPMTAAALGSVPVEKSGVGSGVLNTFRQVGGALGIAVMGAIVASYVDLDGGRPDPSSFIDGFQTALRVSAAFALLGALVAWATIRSTATWTPASWPKRPHSSAVYGPKQATTRRLWLCGPAEPPGWCRRELARLRTLIAWRLAEVRNRS